MNEKRIHEALKTVRDLSPCLNPSDAGDACGACRNCEISGSALAIFVEVEKGRRLKNGPRLLSDVVAGLRDLLRQDDRRRRGNPFSHPTVLGCVEVYFQTPGGEEFDFALDQALDAIANDLFFDERGDWSDAVRALVRTI